MKDFIYQNLREGAFGIMKLGEKEKMATEDF